MTYRNHNPMDVLKSPHYMKHVSAMTTEELHGKAEIAEELAWRDIQIEQLRAELAAEREKVAQLESQLRVTEDGVVILQNQLTAAQATIAQMREAMEECRFALEPYDDVKPRDWKTDRERLARAHKASKTAIAIHANLDALHEDRALECERLADWRVHNRCTYTEKESAAWLREEAAAHRERKEGK